MQQLCWQLAIVHTFQVFILHSPSRKAQNQQQQFANFTLASDLLLRCFFGIALVHVLGCTLDFSVRHVWFSQYSILFGRKAILVWSLCFTAAFFFGLQPLLIWQI